MDQGDDRDGASGTVVPSHAIVEEIAKREGVPIEEVAPPTYQPLHDVVDPQALDDLFTPRKNGKPRGTGRVTFEYCGYEITVESDGSVSIEE